MIKFTFKYCFLLLIASVVMVNLSGCGKDDDPDSDNAFPTGGITRKLLRAETTEGYCFTDFVYDSEGRFTSFKEDEEVHNIQYTPLSINFNNEAFYSLVNGLIVSTIQGDEKESFEYFGGRLLKSTWSYETNSMGYRTSLTTNFLWGDGILRTMGVFSRSAGTAWNGETYINESSRTVTYEYGAQVAACPVIVLRDDYLIPYSAEYCVDRSLLGFLGFFGDFHLSALPVKVTVNHSDGSTWIRLYEWTLDSAGYITEVIVKDGEDGDIINIVTYQWE